MHRDREQKTRGKLVQSTHGNRTSNYKSSLTFHGGNHSCKPLYIPQASSRSHCGGCPIVVNFVRLVTFRLPIKYVVNLRHTDLKSAILGRFFHRMFSCGAQDLNISFHSPKETPQPGGGLRVQVDAAWMFTYSSGYTVTLSGPLVVIIQPGAPAPELNGISPPPMRFTTIQFVAVKVDKKIYCEAIEGKRLNGDPGLGYENIKKGHHPADTDGSSPPMGLTAKQATRNPNAPFGAQPWVEIKNAKLPPDPVNEYGIPQSLLVCLDVSPHRFISSIYAYPVLPMGIAL